MEHLQHKDIDGKTAIFSIDGTSANITIFPTYVTTQDIPSYICKGYNQKRKSKVWFNRRGLAVILSSVAGKTADL